MLEITAIRSTHRNTCSGYLLECSDMHLTNGQPHLEVAELRKRMLTLADLKLEHLPILLWLGERLCEMTLPDEDGMMISPPAKRSVRTLRRALLLGYGGGVLVGATVLAVFVAVTAAHQHRSPWGAWYVFVVVVVSGLVGLAVIYFLTRRDERRGL